MSYDISPYGTDTNNFNDYSTGGDFTFNEFDPNQNFNFDTYQAYDPDNPFRERTLDEILGLTPSNLPLSFSSGVENQEFSQQFSSISRSAIPDFAYFDQAQSQSGSQGDMGYLQTSFQEENSSPEAPLTPSQLSASQSRDNVDLLGPISSDLEDAGQWVDPSSSTVQDSNAASIPSGPLDEDEGLFGEDDDEESPAEIAVETPASASADSNSVSSSQNASPPKVVYGGLTLPTTPQQQTAVHRNIASSSQNIAAPKITNSSLTLPTIPRQGSTYQNFSPPAENFHMNRVRADSTRVQTAAVRQQGFEYQKMNSASQQSFDNSGNGYTSPYAPQMHVRTNSAANSNFNSAPQRAHTFGQSNGNPMHQTPRISGQAQQTEVNHSNYADYQQTGFNLSVQQTRVSNGAGVNSVSHNMNNNFQTPQNSQQQQYVQQPAQQTPVNNTSSTRDRNACTPAPHQISVPRASAPRSAVPPTPRQGSVQKRNVTPVTTAPTFRQTPVKDFGPIVETRLDQYRYAGLFVPLERVDGGSSASAEDNDSGNDKSGGFATPTQQSQNQNPLRIQMNVGFAQCNSFPQGQAMNNINTNMRNTASVQQVQSNGNIQQQHQQGGFVQGTGRVFSKGALAPDLNMRNTPLSSVRAQVQVSAQNPNIHRRSASASSSAQAPATNTCTTPPSAQTVRTPAQAPSQKTQTPTQTQPRRPMRPHQRAMSTQNYNHFGPAFSFNEQQDEDNFLEMTSTLALGARAPDRPALVSSSAPASTRSTPAPAPSRKRARAESSVDRDVEEVAHLAKKPAASTGGVANREHRSGYMAGYIQGLKKGGLFKPTSISLDNQVFEYMSPPSSSDSSLPFPTTTRPILSHIPMESWVMSHRSLVGDKKCFITLRQPEWDVMYPAEAGFFCRMDAEIWDEIWVEGSASGKAGCGVFDLGNF